MRGSYFLLILALAFMLAGCSGGGGDPTSPHGGNAIALYLYPRSIFTITGKPVELNAQALMDDGTMLGVAGICQLHMDDPGMGAFEGNVFTPGNPGSCKVWATFDGVSSDPVDVVVDEEGDPSIEALDSNGNPARRFRLADSLYYSGKGLEPFSPYTIELTDTAGVVLETMVLTSDAWGNIPPTPIWFDIGLGGDAHSGDSLSGLRWGQALGTYGVEVGTKTGLVAQEIINIVNNEDPFILATYDGGEPTNTFHTTIDINVKGANFIPGEEVRLLVFSDRFDWNNGGSIANPIAEANVVAGADGSFLKGLGKIPTVDAYDLIADCKPFADFLGVEDLVNGVMTVGFTVQKDVEPGQHIITQVAGKKTGNNSLNFTDIFDLQEDDVYTWVNPPIRPFVMQVGKPLRYIVDHQDVWEAGDPLNDITAVGEASAVELGCYNSPPVLTDPAPHNTGFGSELRKSGSRFADVILDANQNGQYDPGLDILDNILDPQHPDLLAYMAKTGQSIIPPGTRTVQVDGYDYYQIGGIYVSAIDQPLLSAKFITDIIIETLLGQKEIEGQGYRAFKAKALYKNGTTEDISSQVTWCTSDPVHAVPVTETPGRYNFITAGSYDVWAEYKIFTSPRLTVDVHAFAPPQWRSTSGVQQAKYFTQGQWQLQFNGAEDFSDEVHYRLYLFNEYPYGDFAKAYDAYEIVPSGAGDGYEYSSILNGFTPSEAVLFGLRAFDKFGLETGNTDVYYADPLAVLLDFYPGWLMYAHNPQHTSRADFAGPAAPVWGWMTIDTPYSGVTGYPDGSDDYPLYVMLENTLLCFTVTGDFLWEYDVPETLQSGDQHLPTVIPEQNGVYLAAGNNFYHIVSPGAADSVIPLPGRAEGAPTLGPSDRIYIPCEPNLLVAVTPNEGIIWQVQIPGMVGLPALGYNNLLYVTAGSQLFALGPLDGEIVFINEIPGSATGPVIGDDGTVYVLRKQHATALTQEGYVKWDCPVFALKDDIFPPAIGQNGRLYFTAEEGIYAVNADGSLAWSAPILFSQFTAPPTVDATGRVYLTTIGTSLPNRYLSVYTPDGALLKKIEVMPGFGECQPNIIDDGILFVGLTMVQ